MQRFAAAALLVPLAAAATVPPAAVAGSPRPLADAALYDAYHELHALSQHTALNHLKVPKVLVVGRQTDGKSALIEALMGFQFNHVGGGTKTRRPIALQMQYHPDRETPSCYLQTARGRCAARAPACAA